MAMQVMAALRRAAAAVLVGLGVAGAGGGDARAGDDTTVFDGVVLQDQNGRLLPLDRLRGRTVVLNFVFTGCSSICPLQSRELALVQQAIPAARRAQIHFLSVSVDPLNDTPAALKRFALASGADLSHWSFATGRPAEIDRFARRLRAFDPRRTEPAPADHTTSIYLFDPRGRLTQRYATLDRARLAREILQLDRIAAGTTP